MTRAVASAALFAAALVLQGPLTATMARHMFVHIPMLLGSGMLAGLALARHADARPGACRRALGVYRGFDEFGVPGLLLASFAGAYWMIPRALDLVLSSGAADAAKFAVLFVVGMILMDSLSRANTVIKLFFLGNFCWMAAVVGMIYQSNPARLCNFYLQGDQETAGAGLVALAVALPACWALYSGRRLRRFLRD